MTASIKGLRKARKPGERALWARVVSITLPDPQESAAALSAVLSAAGRWWSEDSMGGGLRCPRGENIGGAALAEALVRIQERCHQAAIDAVMRLRDPGYESPSERVEREAAEAQVLNDRRARLVVRLWRATSEELAAVEEILTP